MEIVYDCDIGDTVVCDWCNMEFTNSVATGGGVVGSEAVCPYCWGMVLKNADGVKRCPRTMTFKEFVMKERNGNNRITIAVEN